MLRQILIIGDYQGISKLIGKHLSATDYTVEIEPNGNTGFERAISSSFQLIILTLPDVDGVKIWRKLRDQHINIPTIMLTVKSSESEVELILNTTSSKIERMLGLESDADEYLNKPFGIQELPARVKVIFRHIENYQQEYKSETNEKFNILKEGYPSGGIRKKRRN